jgi:hypothetical protein
VRSSDFGCEAIAGLMEGFLDGDLGRADEERVRTHLEACPACRARYALDLALVVTIRNAPEEAFEFESVAGAVSTRVRARERRSWALRWGVVVAAVTLIGLGTRYIEAGFREPLISLLRGGLRQTSTYIAFTKLMEVARDLAGALKSAFLTGGLPGGLGSYAPLAALIISAAGALVILMMYGMGRWLNKPTGVNSWRRS